MLQRLKEITQHSAIYGVSNVLNKAIAFFLIPLYTSYLAAEDYGRLEIFVVTVNFLILLLPLGLNSAVFAFVIHNDEKNTREVMATAFNALLIFSSLICGLFYIFSPSLSDLIFGNGSFTAAFRIIAITTFLECVRLIPLAKLRIENRSLLYAVLNTLRFTLNLLFNIYFLVYARAGIEGILKAGMYSAAIAAVFTLIPFRRDLHFLINRKMVKDLLKFGAPLVPAAAAASILSMSDRYFLKYYSTLDELGVYSLGYRFGAAITFVTMAFQIAWPTFLFSIAREQNAKRMYSKILTYFLTALFFLFLIISVLAKDVIAIIAPSQYHAAHKVVALVALSYIFYGAYYVTAVGVNLEKKNHFLPLVVGAAAALNLFSNFLLIPKYGMMGAAWATFVSYFVMFVGTTALSLRYYFIKYEYGRIFKMAATALAIYFVSLFVPARPLVLALTLKILLIGVFPFLLHLFKFYEAVEIASIKNILLRSRSTKPPLADLNDY